VRQHPIVAAFAPRSFRSAGEPQVLRRATIRPERGGRLVPYATQTSGCTLAESGMGKCGSGVLASALPTGLLDWSE